MFHDKGGKKKQVGLRRNGFKTVEPNFVTVPSIRVKIILKPLFLSIFVPSKKIRTNCSCARQPELNVAVFFSHKNSQTPVGHASVNQRIKKTKAG